MPKGVAKGRRKERRPNLTPKEERQIVEHVLRDESQKKSREALAREINRMLPQKEPASAEYLKKRISEIRSKEDSEGQLWTIGTKADIPHEALPSVLRCCREANVTGSSFTIREARWCARLSSLIEDSLTLRSWASVYANLELAHKILEKENEFDTSDFDRILITPPWELVTTYLVGLAKPVETGLHKFHIAKPFARKPIPTKAQPSHISSAVVELDTSLIYVQAKVSEFKFLYGPNAPKDQEVFKAISAEYGWLLQQWWFADEQGKKQWGAHPSYQKFINTWKPILTVADLETLDLSQEAMRVYTLWLGYLAKGPSMTYLSLSNRRQLRKEVLNRLEILLELRRWVKNHKLASNSQPLSEFPWPLIPPLDRVAALFDLKPIDILRKVGYEN